MSTLTHHQALIESEAIWRVLSTNADCYAALRPKTIASEIAGVDVSGYYSLCPLCEFYGKWRNHHACDNCEIGIANMKCDDIDSIYANWLFKKTTESALPMYEIIKKALDAC